MANLFEVKNLTLIRNNKHICQNFSFVLEQGQRWGILGLNGRGKTTLLHTLAGLLLPASGVIYFNNKNLNHLTRKIIAQNIGLLLQEQQYFFPALVIDTVLAGGHSRSFQCQQKLTEILQNVKLAHLSEHNILHLSGGEQQRVGIARLLFQNPRVFLLDEPVNQLDPLHQFLVMDFFYKLCVSENKAIIFSTHDINLVERYCDHVVLLLEDGVILAGPKKELLTTENLLHLYGCSWNKISDHVWHQEAALI